MNLEKKGRRLCNCLVWRSRRKIDMLSALCKTERRKKKGKKPQRPIRKEGRKGPQKRKGVSGRGETEHT